MTERYRNARQTSTQGTPLGKRPRRKPRIAARLCYDRTHMTRTNTSILSGVIVVALVLGCLVWHAASKSTGTVTNSTLSATSLGTHSPYKASGTYFTIAANFPTTTPLSAATNSTALSQMRSWVENQVTQFKQDSGVATITPALAQKQGLTNGRQYTLNIVYLEGFSAHTYSYIFTVYEDTGGAHGNTFFKTFTFDAASGKLLSLGDVFTGNYLQKLSAISRQTLDQNLGKFAVQNMITSGTSPGATNFQNWFFDNKDFVLLFPPYQVAAYAAGPQTVRIPASELDGFLAPNYP